ncbi:unnamed protein product [Psylliodes chrysocephalus]|uniref:Uncharacterized protein n=1 Tax=Psylliodes chrysocephalus TaxID=3402493 RepID=A0A9P0DC75_9CUCU|nr:unnamed protein product [Psylliodes chrysocephala]
MKAQDDTNSSPKDTLKVSGFIPVIDPLCVSLAKRLHAYDAIRLKFGFLNHLEEMDVANLYAATDELVKVYKDDLEPFLVNELVQFNYIPKHRNHGAIVLGIKGVKLHCRALIFKNENDKNRIGTTMGQNRLSKLSLLSIENIQVMQKISGILWFCDVCLDEVNNNEGLRKEIELLEHSVSEEIGKLKTNVPNTIRKQFTKLKSSQKLQEVCLGYRRRINEIRNVKDGVVIKYNFKNEIEKVRSVENKLSISYNIESPDLKNPSLKVVDTENKMHPEDLII